MRLVQVQDYRGKMAQSMHDLNLRCKAGKTKENGELLKQSFKLGWTVSAANTSSFGKTTGKTTGASATCGLDNASLKECAKYRALVGESRTDFEQLSRITVTVDEILDAQALTVGNEAIRIYDIVAACPGNATVFAYLCKSAQVDIICIDFTRKVTFPLNKSLLDQAVKRGVHFEILYAPLLNAPNSRKDVLAGTRVLVQFLRGRNIILSSGAENATDIRGPFDVINMGQLLNLTAQQARDAIGKNCVAVIQHAQARKLRYVPVEVLSTEDAQKRWPKAALKKGKSAGTKRQRHEDDEEDNEDGEAVRAAKKRGAASAVKQDNSAEESGDSDGSESDGAESEGGDIENDHAGSNDKGKPADTKEDSDSDSDSGGEGAGNDNEEDDGYLKF